MPTLHLLLQAQILQQLQRIACGVVLGPSLHQHLRGVRDWQLPTEFQCVRVFLQPETIGGEDTVSAV